MLEPRIYRAAFVPALLAMVLVMFSLESRPRPLAQGLAADVLFDGRQAAAAARLIVAGARDRRAGTPGDRAVAATVRQAFKRRGFGVQVDRFGQGGKDLVNVVGRRAGKSRRQIVVVAARDASGVPDAGGSAADTAALLELSRVFEGRPSNKTLVLASVDGSTLGQVGARRLEGSLESPDLVDGVVVVSGLGSRTRAAPAIVPWSGDVTRAGIGLQRTVAESLTHELSRPAPEASPGGQLARLAFPLGIGSQGVLLDEGYDAVRIAGVGEVDGSSGAAVDQDRLGGLGRATLRTLTALDQGGKPAHGPRTYVTVAGQVMPGWVLSLLGIALLLPVLVASVDAFARSRRRRHSVAPWLTWLGAGALAFAIGLGLALALALAGATPDPPPAPVPPDLYPLDAAAAAVLGAVVGAVALAWFGLRHLVRRSEPDLADLSSPAAAVAVALVLSLATLATWLVNPYSALILAPSLHLWILATLTDPPPRRRTRLAMVAGGLVLPALLVLYHLITLGIDPLGGAWYVLLLVAGGHVSFVSALLGCIMAAALGSIWAIARARHPEVEAPAEKPSVRGPGSYAGPGSLGGTPSALRR
ncbi:MAG: hypothetical protein M3131_02060 [Actinomycetota bacterium]|nr:hypothetical protein [Actinomycetota bacterium]